MKPPSRLDVCHVRQGGAPGYCAHKWLLCPLPQLKQESLANAKVRARQPWYIRRNNSLNWPHLGSPRNIDVIYIVEKYFQCATIPSLAMRVYLHSFSCCCLPNMPTSTKFRENLNWQQFKVIQGQWFWYQSKRMCDFLLVINSNFGPILHLSEIQWLIGWKLGNCLRLSSMPDEPIKRMALQCCSVSFKQRSKRKQSVATCCDVAVIMTDQLLSLLALRLIYLFTHLLTYLLTYLPEDWLWPISSSCWPKDITSVYLMPMK